MSKPPAASTTKPTTTTTTKPPSKPAARSNANTKLAGGVDSVIGWYGKHRLHQPGQSVAFSLVKSSLAKFQQPDPVHVQRAPPEDFPLVAKFPISVVPPDLKHKFRRLYQQNVPPPPEEDSDLEETAEQQQEAARRGKRKRGRNRDNDPPQRQWVLQEEMDFAETMVARKERKVLAQRNAASGGTTNAGATANTASTSSRYESTAEHNPSQYMLLQLLPNTTTNNINDPADTNTPPVFQVTLLPTPYAVQTFRQPAARKALTMTQAEQVLQDQRAHVTRFMMHQQQTQQQQSPGGSSRSNAVSSAAVAAAVMSRLTGGRPGGSGINRSKARLLGKLGSAAAGKDNGDDDDDDDVMADVTFRTRKRGGGAGSSRGARKELLSAFSDENIAVDDEGVLGGTNDAEFGGKRRFGRLQIMEKHNSDVNTGGNAASSATNDGNAMADDFYQRDVQAEYDDLDYDANEQFDDDDVDVGETEVAVDTSGGFDDNASDQEEDDEEEEDPASQDVSSGGAEGLASLAGFRAMLDKARKGDAPTTAAAAVGATADANSAAAADDKMDTSVATVDEDGNPISSDNASTGATNGAATTANDAAGTSEAASLPADGNTSGNNTNSSNNNNKSSKRKRKDAVDEDDELTQIMAAAERAVAAKKSGKAGIAGEPKITGMELDENGQRLLTLEAIRREIWLNHGAIASKRLIKIFNINKKSTSERQENFKSLVRELCIMTEDPIGGRKLVLKQHYANMG